MKIIKINERLFLQLSILIFGFVPVLAGTSGMFNGAAMLQELTSPSLDSHFRYLSGLLFAIGIAFWAAIPSIEAKTSYIRLLTSLVFIGGLARLASAIFIATPSISMLLALGMELVVTPLLCLWQARISALNVRLSL